MTGRDTVQFIDSSAIISTLGGVEGEALITWVVVKDYEDQAGITGMGQQIAYESTLIPST